MRIFSSFILSLTLCVGWTTAYAAGDAQAGKASAATCMGCHGAPGLRNAYPAFRVPKLGGQQEQYLIVALKAYQSGERSHPTMQAQAGSMTDAEINNVAAYLSSLAGPDATALGDGDADAGAAKAQACFACHGPGGKKPIAPMYPSLAGQYPDYLSHALADYKSGARNNAIMKGFASALSKKDMEDIAAYFGSQASPLSTPINW
ncbi:MAG: c-type cytochrome [Gammaproteobacteria bacterium]|jgi:cytochrome c553